MKAYIKLSLLAMLVSGMAGDACGRKRTGLPPSGAWPGVFLFWLARCPAKPLAETCDSL